MNWRVRRIDASIDRKQAVFRHARAVTFPSRQHPRRDEIGRKLRVDHRRGLHTGCGSEDGRLPSRREIPGGVDTRNRRLTRHRIDLDEPLLVERDAQDVHEIDLPLWRVHQQRVAGYASAPHELDGLQLVPGAGEPRH
jgi:hypothetical protein